MKQPKVATENQDWIRMRNLGRWFWRSNRVKKMDGRKSHPFFTNQSWMDHGYVQDAMQKRCDFFQNTENRDTTAHTHF